MWIHLPSTCCPSAPEAGGSISASAWRSKLLASSAALSTKRTAAKNWLRKWKRTGWMKRLFGRICEPSMASRGVERWIASLRASPAKDSRSPASEAAPPIPVTCGRMSSEFFPSADHPLLFSKMCPALFPRQPSNTGPTSWPTLPPLPISSRLRRLLGQSGICRTTAIACTTDSSAFTVFRRCCSFSPSWRLWVTELRRACLRRRKSVPPTSESGCSSWPTVNCRDDRLGCNQRQLATETAKWRTPAGQEPGISNERLEGGEGHRAYDKETGRLAQYGVTQQAQMWQAVKPPGGGDKCRSGDRKGEMLLGGQVRQWPSPRSEDSECCGNHPGAVDSLTGATKLWKTPHGMGNEDATGKMGGAGGGEFAKQANLWPSPAAGDDQRDRCSDRVQETKAARPDSSSDLPVVARLWGTPISCDRAHNPRPVDHGIQLANQSHCFRPAPETSKPGDASSKSPRRLNPLFVRWLMGWYLEPMSCGCSETAWSLYKRRMRSVLFGLVCKKESSSDR